jgi:hypothetical protein
VTRKSKSYWIGTQFYVENDEGVSVVLGDSILLNGTGYCTLISSRDIGM